MISSSIYPETKVKKKAAGTRQPQGIKRNLIEVADIRYLNGCFSPNQP